MAETILVCALCLVAASVQGFFGFGFGIVAMSALTLFRDIGEASGVVNLTAILLSLAMLWRAEHLVLWQSVRRIAPAMVVGIALGLLALRDFDRELMVNLLGITVIGVAAWNLLALRLSERDSRGLDLGVGLVAGLLSGAFNTGGPPLVAHLYRRRESPAALVVTVQVIFVISSVVRAALSVGQGLIGRAIAVESLWAAPFVVVGALLGARAARRSSPERFRRAAWVAFGCLGLALLVSS